MDKLNQYIVQLNDILVDPRSGRNWQQESCFDSAEEADQRANSLEKQGYVVRVVEV